MTKHWKIRASVYSMLWCMLSSPCTQTKVSLYSYECECVRIHNRYRAMHWAQNLFWDEQLARDAQKLAKYLERTNMQLREYGRLDQIPSVNIFWSREGDTTCEEAAAEWYHEIAWYNRNGFCQHPPRNMADALYNYGRFIQMVWRGASRIGVALVALMLRRIENWISGSGSAVTQIKRGELESRDAKYLKKLEKKRESERIQIERSVSKLRKDSVISSIKTKETTTMTEILSKTKQTKVKPFRSEAKRKQILKTTQVPAVHSVEVTKQELPNPVKFEQETSEVTQNSDKFVKYRNRKVQISPPLKESGDATVQAKSTAVKLPPLKEQLRNKDRSPSFDNNFKPKHKRKLSDILRNLPKRITSHKSINESDAAKENQSQDNESAAKEKSGGKNKNERKSPGEDASRCLPSTSESQEANKMKYNSSDYSSNLAKNRKKSNVSDANRLKQDSSAFIKSVKPILKRSIAASPVENRICPFDLSLQTEGETQQAEGGAFDRPSSASQRSPTSSTYPSQGEYEISRSIIKSESPAFSEDDNGSGPAHALQSSKVDKYSEDFTNPEVILKYRLATTAGNKKHQADNILNETTYENYKRDLTVSPKFKPLTRPMSADSPDTGSVGVYSPTANASDVTGEKRRTSRLYDDEELKLMESIESEFL